MENPDNDIFRESREGSTGDDKKTSGVNYHPWRRFLARSIDLFLASFFVAGLSLSALGLFLPGMVSNAVTLFQNPLLAGVIVYVFWIPLEAFFLSRTGSTPGKRLFGIQVLSQSGDRLLYSNALQRTFLVWIKGEGLGIPIATVVTRIFAYKRLQRTGTTLWDSAMGTVVRHSDFTMFRTVVCAIVVATMVFVTLFLSLGGKV